MIQETPLAPTTAIDWNKVGSPTCDTGAQTEAARAIGVGTDGRFLNRTGDGPGQQGSINLAMIREQAPHLYELLLSRDANGNVVWNPQLDIATLSTVRVEGRDKDRLDSMQRDGHVNTTEIEAAVIAISQLARANAVAQQLRTQPAGPRNNITNQEIVDAMAGVTIEQIRGAMQKPLCEITGSMTPSCGIGSPNQAITRR